MVFLSSFFPWLPIAIFILYFIFKKQNRTDFVIIFFYLFLLLAMTDSSTSYFFKNIFGRIRPCHMPELKNFIIDFGQRCGGKNGFFSSHAANAFALGSFLISFTKMRKVSKVIVWFILFLIAYSRIYLGVHLPLDVFIGGLWGILLSRLWIFLATNSFKEPSVS